MNIEGMTAPEARAYLTRKGWQETGKEDAWQWRLPPCPGEHTMEHAVQVQKGLDNARKGNKTKASA